jgi:hypothetical protein
VEGAVAAEKAEVAEGAEDYSKAGGWLTFRFFRTFRSFRYGRHAGGGASPKMGRKLLQSIELNRAALS